ncbi:MAG: response regulator [Methyloprofundus sp.]|nr:response regulator [Methyloprofundus sp.]
MLRVLSENLGLRILFLSLGLAALLAILVVIVFSLVFLEESKQRFFSEEQATTDTIVRLIDDSLVKRRQGLVELTQLLQADNQLKPNAELQRILDERILLHEFFNGGLLLLNADAVALVDSPILPNRVGTSYDDRPHIQWVAQHLEAYISHPFVGRRLQTPIFTINAPILNQQGKLLGYMIGISLLKDDFMIKDLAEHFMDADAEVYVVDFENDMFVSSTLDNYTFKPFDAEEDSLLMQQLKQGVKQGEAVGFDGKPVQFKAKKLAHINWYVLTVHHLDKVMAPTYQLLTRGVGLVLGFLLVTLPLFYFLMRQQLKPLEHASTQIDQALHQPSPVKLLDVNSQDEVGRLINAFNHLIERQNHQQQALLEARDQASQTNQMKSSFLAAMSHDIRTPLNGILGLSEMGMRAQNDPQKMQESLQKIQLCGQGLLALLNDILDLSKIEAGELGIDPKPFYFETLVAGLKAQFEPTLQQKDLSFIVKLDPTLLPVYRADSHRIEQVLTNLIGNAIKFTEAGFVRLSISHVRKDEDQAWLGFEIEDSGIGMNEKQMARLFKAFSQGDDSISRKFGGTGLGLKICQDLVGLMGGQAIKVQSRPGHGSLFSFELPMGWCSELETQKAIEQAGHEWPSSAESPSFKLEGKILVAEDNSINQEIILELLDQLGLEVYLAENGKQAVEMVTEQTFDLVLMDKQMPEMDGYEATRKIREFNQSIPIIALTADAMSDEKAKSKAAGLNDYLTKPVDYQQLIKVLAQWLNPELGAMTKQQLASPLIPARDEHVVIDLAEGLKMLGGKQAFYRSMLQAYQAQLEQDVTLILQGFEQIQDSDHQAWSELERSVHGLKGVSANLGARQMVIMLEALESFVYLKQVPSPFYWKDWQETIFLTQQEINRALVSDNKLNPDDYNFTN